MIRFIKKIGLKVVRFFPMYWYRSFSFSQDGEDMILKAFFEEDKKHKGFYVDVGAHHPYRFSNTAYFYKKGWRGINIEPTPTLIQSFKRYRKKDTNLNLGISNEDSSLTFYQFNESALNSFAEILSKERHNEDNNYRIINTIQVDCYKLSTILDNYLPEGRIIDFFTIDVEGYDLEVLKSNNWEKYRPKFILIEQNLKEFNIENFSQDDIYIYLQSLNYKFVARTKRTSVFQSF